MVTPVLAVLGDGKMGRAIEARAAAHGFEIAGVFGREALVDRREVVSAVESADIAIEVSTPESAVDNALLCLAAGCPVVVGSTGWRDDDGVLADAVARHDGALLTVPNFAIGVGLMRVLCERLAPWLGGAKDFDVSLVETHHAQKRDAPSGTARMLADVVRRGSGRDVPVTSVRTGHVPGTHELALDGPFERLTLRHEARDRRLFADGALRAAGWLRGRRGMWTMEQMFDDVLGRDGEER